MVNTIEVDISMYSRVIASLAVRTIARTGESVIPSCLMLEDVGLINSTFIKYSYPYLNNVINIYIYSVKA